MAQEPGKWNGPRAEWARASIVQILLRAPSILLRRKCAGGAKKEPVWFIWAMGPPTRTES